MTLSLQCAIVGKAGDSFEVKIDDAKKVSALKEAIKKIKMYQFPAKELQLFLVKRKDGKWLLEESDAAQKLEGGESVPEIMEMIDKNKMLPSWTIEETLADFKMTGELAPSSKQVHVLVVVPVETESRPTKRQKIDLEAAHSLPHYLPEIYWSDAEQRTRLPSSRR